MTAGAARGKEVIPPPQKGSNPRRDGAGRRISLLDIDEVASWLGVEVSFIRRQIAERKIPFVKIGKYVRFDPTDIAEWIDGQRVQPERRTSHPRKFRDA